MYLAMDNEMGGFEKETSLLTSYLAVYDDFFQLVDELYLKLIPDDGLYRVNPEGLAVNKIDLVELAKEAIPYKKAGTVLYKFLEWNFIAADSKLVPLGQNVQGDIEGLRGVIVSEGSWDNFVARRPLDTMYISRFLQEVGLLPAGSISLASLVEYFGIKVEGEAHDAKVDVLRTVEVYKNLRELVLNLAPVSPWG